MWKSIFLGLTISAALTSSAMAQSCISYPNPLTNGTPANGSDVIGDMTYMSGCLAPLVSPSFTGNVGIGTMSATQPLFVVGNMETDNTGDGAQLIFSKSGAADWALQKIESDSTGRLRIYDYVNGIERMSFLHNGNVGIDTSSPSQLFHVNTGTSEGGNQLLVGASNDSASIWLQPYSLVGSYNPITQAGDSGIFFGPSGGTGSLVIAPWSTSSSGVRITGTGNVGIGTATPAYTLHVNGSVAGTSAYVNLSDKRLKKDIRPIDGALSIVERLQGVRFAWKDINKRIVGKTLNLPVGTPQVGFIAQDVERVLPEAVSTASGPEKIESVAESKVVPVLVEALKELKATNDNQAAKIQKLETRVSVLERKGGLRTAQN